MTIKEYTQYIKLEVVPVAISIYNDFSEYMMFKGIKRVEKIESVVKDKNIKVDTIEDLIINQFSAIHDFHKKAMGFNGYLRNRLNNNTGKVIEGYKVSLKRLSADLRKIKNHGPTNPFEEIIIRYGQEIINKGEGCVKAAYKSDYIGIITRSMRRTEICLGNTDFKNLRKINAAEVVSFKECSYNMVEMDCFFFLSKLKKKGVRLNYEKLIEEFCYIEELDESSSKFLMAIISYPNEFIKCCNKYRDGKNKWNEEEFPKKLLNNLIRESNSLLNFEDDDLKR